MKKLSTYKLDVLSDYMTSEGYLWDYEFHLIGIRESNNVSILNGLEDTLVMIINGEEGYEFPMNTRSNPVMLQTGQYTYTKCKHYVHYGQQRSPVIMRDTVEDVNLYDEYDPKLFGVQLIFHPLHLIRPFSTKSALSNQSAGSQIITPLAYSMYKKHAKDIYTYTLIDEDQI
jgi:hypothetical protein